MSGVPAAASNGVPSPKTTEDRPGDARLLFSGRLF
jgi:hypothetical protein